MMRSKWPAAAIVTLALAAAPRVGGWTIQHPLPTGQDLTALAFLDTNTGYAAGAGQTWLKTVDGGLNWTPLTAFTTLSVYRLGFLGRDTGFAHGSSWQTEVRTLYRTADGGKAWRAARFPDTVPCGPDGYHFINGNEGWAAGSLGSFSTGFSGAIHRTTDGGVTWSRQAYDRTRALHATFFMDSRRGWAVGDSGLILHTGDGGATWTPQASGLVKNLKAIHFVDALTGWCAGDFGARLRTRDGGATWEDISATGTSFTSVRFATRDTGWLEGFDGSFHRTTDGGASWAKMVLPSGHNQPLALHVQDARRAWVAGSTGSLLRTRDAGGTWEILSKGTRLRIDWLHMIDERTGWATGSNGTLLKTTDGGRNWLQQPGGPGTIIHRIQFVDARTGWLATGYSILATADGGATWQARPQPGGAEFFRFLDAQRGFAVGRYGVVRKTVDGGRSWQALDTVTKSNLTDVHFSDPLHGIAVGEDGTALFTRDGGETWAVRTVIAREDLAAVQMLDSNRAWTGAADFDGSMFKTEDGGATWTAGPKLGDPVHSLHFNGPLHGAATGFDAPILRTRDGGKTWLRQGSPAATTLALNTIHVLDSARAWAAGEEGLIIQDGPLPPIAIRPIAQARSGGLLRVLASDAFEYRLARAEWVRARILDPRGRHLSLLEGRQEPGLHRLKVPEGGARSRPSLLEFRAGRAREILLLP